MKKLLILVSLIALVFSCTGCGKSEDTHNHSNESTQPPTNTATRNPNDKDESGMAGSNEGNTYTNTYLDLTFKAPDNWVFLDNSALSSLTGADTALSVKEAVDTLGASYAMMAIESSTEASVSIVYENLLITSGSLLTAQEYADSIIKQGVNQTSQSDLSGEGKLVIGENEYVKVVITTKDPNKPMLQTHYLRAIEDYMVHITTSIPASSAEAVNFVSMFE